MFLGTTNVIDQEMLFNQTIKRGRGVDYINFESIFGDFFTVEIITRTIRSVERKEVPY